MGTEVNLLGWQQPASGFYPQSDESFHIAAPNPSLR